MSSGRDADVRTAVERLVSHADIEVIPMRGAEQKWQSVPVGSTVTITCSAKLGLQRTLDYATLAVEAGYRAVPHIAARQVTDERELRTFLSRLDDLAIHDLYVIGGDPDTPAGPYESADQLLSAIANISSGVDRIGIAGYPEGHPKIGDDDLMAALLAKQDRAHYIVTQMCFDADALARWITSIRAAGVTLPVHLGLAAPMSTRKLAELSVRIGVGSSLRFLTKQHGVISNLLRGSSYKPEKLLLANHGALVSPNLGIEGLHLFSFNQVQATTEWQRRVVGHETAASA